MFRIVLVDHAGHAAGWIDDRGQFTAVLWEAACFPTQECAIQALRDTRRIQRHRADDGCGWHLQRIEATA